MDKLCFSSISEIWCFIILDTLYRQGVRDICIAPGSRSAPLTLAAARYAGQENPDLRLHCHFDERGLGFFALGIAKANQRPTGIITTSGTAVANLYPAVIEAFESSVPLILLTADRPEELLNCGANQAINQRELFGENVVHNCQLPVPTLDLSPDELVDSISQAVWTGVELSGGPVQINCPFREPLYGEVQTANPPTGSPPTEFGAYLANYVPDRVSMPRRHFQPKPEFWPASSKGLLIAGNLNTAQAHQVFTLAEHLGWPVFADITSQLRLLRHPLIIDHHDVLLGETETLQTLKSVDQLIQFGGRLTSKKLNQWLAQYRGNYLLCSDRGKKLDPNHRARQMVIDINTNLRDENNQQPPTDLARNLQQLNNAVQTRLTRQNFETFNELSIVRQLTCLLPPKMALFAGNSLAIRILELLAYATSGNPVYSNRGASGIDGLLATAAGCALNHPEGLTLLIGDTSLLHDLNSLALASELELPFVIVVLNNDGGGIFDLVAKQVDSKIRQNLFRCPHGLQFADASKMFDINYSKPATLTTFKQDYQQACRQSKCSLIEINVAAGQTVKLLESFRKTQGIKA